MVLNAEIVARIMALFEDGRSERYVARVMGMPRTTVQRAIQRYRETGLYTRRPGSGRPRPTNQADDRFVMIQSLRNRHQTAVQITQALHTARQVDVCVETVRRRLAEVGLHSRTAATGPLLTPAHRRARLEFARSHQNWTDAEWATVMFSDETRINLYGSDNRTKVRRRPGERYAQCNISPRVQFGGGSVMIWGGITMEAKTELHVFRRPSMNSNIYIRDVLEEYVVPFAPYIGDNFIFMQDNARPHIARVVMEYLEEVEIRKMD